jgi:alpha-tubulin suppressor-like RCC1 family protein
MIYEWGDRVSGKLGRMASTRQKNNQAFSIEKMDVKHAQDIWAGSNHLS